MLYMMKRPSGGRGEYEIAGATDMYSAADLQDHEVVVSFGAGINLATGAILRLDSGKLRLRIERGDMHIHRQLAAALLMPRPRREESRLVPSVDSAIADRNYVLRRVTFDAAVLDGATAVVTPGSLETDSRSYVGSQSFTDRWSRVRYVVENRTSLEASIAMP